MSIAAAPSALIAYFMRMSIQNGMLTLQNQINGQFARMSVEFAQQIVSLEQKFVLQTVFSIRVSNVERIIEEIRADMIDKADFVKEFERRMSTVEERIRQIDGR